MMLLKFILKFMSNEKKFDIWIKEVDVYENNNRIVDLYFRTASSNGMTYLLSVYDKLFNPDGVECSITKSDEIIYQGKFHIYQISKNRGKMHIALF